MFAFVLLGLYFLISATPRDWLGRTSAKWHVLCRMARGRKNL